MDACSQTNSKIHRTKSNQEDAVVFALKMSHQQPRDKQMPQEKNTRNVTDSENPYTWHRIAILKTHCAIFVIADDICWKLFAA